ncbi:hypothetical protein [Aggregatilinea lenta]|uniref:hypothetical protein n=1 Tax=Aggregatilinea lenta TaxID=913108 RepID=UPI000E5A1C4E|nr:hypothetical protein [Aggregatilinea lenta]
MNGVEDEQRVPDEPVDGAADAPVRAPDAEAAAEAPEPVAAPSAEPEPEPVAAAEVAVEDAVEPEPATPSGRWLIVQTSATLRTVASQNCACFGTDGVPRYGPEESGPAHGPAALRVALALRAGRDTRLAADALRMTLLRSNEKEMVWSGFDADRQLQVLWVWDFYRIQSHVALRVALPDAGLLPDTWRAAVDALRAAGPDDEIELEVASACGDFEQPHTLVRGAVEWEKSSG